MLIHRINNLLPDHHILLEMEARQIPFLPFSYMLLLGNILLHHLQELFPVIQSEQTVLHSAELPSAVELIQNS